MVLISHRGNINGPNPKMENRMSYIESALNQNYDCEIDVWYDNGFWLGHDKPTHKISYKWIKDLCCLWVHCKNAEALQYFREKDIYPTKGSGVNYFWHEEDDYTITSWGFVWVYPEKKLLTKSICVMPEKGLNGNLKMCYGICSDEIEKYK
jgi:hypothetical protein